MITGGAAATGGLAIGFNIAGIGDALAQKVLGAAGNEVGAWVYIKPNDEVVIRIARSEMGQGTLTGLGAARRRRTRVRLVKGKVGIPDAGPKPRSQSRLGRHVDRWFARHQSLTRLRPARRRCSPADAVAGCSRCLESARSRGVCRQQRNHARRVEAQDNLRQGRGSRCETAGSRSKDHETQRSERLENRRQSV